MEDLIDSGSFPQKISNAPDVSLTDIQDGQILKYNSTSEKFENADESGGSGETRTTIMFDTTTEINSGGNSLHSQGKLTFYNDTDTDINVTDLNAGAISDGSYIRQKNHHEMIKIGHYDSGLGQFTGCTRGFQGSAPASGDGTEFYLFGNPQLITGWEFPVVANSKYIARYYWSLQNTSSSYAVHPPYFTEIIFETLVPTGTTGKYYIDRLGFDSDYDSESGFLVNLIYQLNYDGYNASYPSTINDIGQIMKLAAVDKARTYGLSKHSIYIETGVNGGAVQIKAATAPIVNFSIYAEDITFNLLPESFIKVIKLP